MRLRSLGIVLLSFEMAVHLLAKLSPIPFLGFAIALLGFPLALKLSWRELFLIEATSILFAWTINMDGLYFQYQWSINTLSGSAPEFVPMFTPLFFIILAATLISAAALSALILKVLSGHTPERLKHIW